MDASPTNQLFGQYMCFLIGKNYESWFYCCLWPYLSPKWVPSTYKHTQGLKFNTTYVLTSCKFFS